MSKIMVIAGGDWQIELIKKAKQMGHYVICSNLYEDSPAFPYADACEVANVLDKEKNLQIAQKYQPDAVISDQSDIAVPTVAYVNEKMGLRGIGTDKADIFTDKKLLCRSTNLRKRSPGFKGKRTWYRNPEYLCHCGTLWRCIYIFIGKRVFCTPSESVRKECRFSTFYCRLRRESPAG